MARPDSRLLDPALYPWRTTVTTRFGDLDTNKHINNVAFSGMFEDGRNRFNRLRGFDEEMPEAQIVIGAIYIDFVGEAFYPEPIDVHVGVSAVGRTSWSLQQIATQGDRVCGFCRTVLVAMTDGKPAALADAFKARLEAARIAGEAPTV